jgi:hypothetical protein
MPSAMRSLAAALLPKTHAEDFRGDFMLALASSLAAGRAAVRQPITGTVPGKRFRPSRPPRGR